MSDIILEKKISDTNLQKETSGVDFFKTSHIQANLKTRSIRGGMITMFNYGVSFLLRTGSTIVLARLLTPRDYGLIAMVTAITSFVMMLKDMGLSTATIQKAEVNHSQVSTLFWLNAAFGFLLSVFTVGLAPLLAWFYGDPRLVWITLALSGVFLFTGLSVQHQALLRRQMKFGVLAVVEITSLTAGIIAAIIAAYFGAAYWALVIMQLVIPVANVIGLWITCKWRPGLPSRKSGIRSMLHFGLNTTGFGIVNYFSRNLDNVLLGRFYGSGVLGLYSRAYQILLMPISYIRIPLTLVAMPAMSRLQDNPARFRAYYTKLTSLLAFVSMPLMVFLAVCSDNIVLILLGEQWSEAGILFKIMAITGFIQTVATTWGLVLLSTGRANRYFRWGVINGILTITSFFVGLPWGARGVAIAYATLTYLILFPSLLYCFKGTPVSIATFMRAIWRPSLASIFMVVVILRAYAALSGRSDIVVIAACLAVGLVVYGFTFLVIPGGLRIIKEYCSYFLILFRRERNPVAT